MKIKNSITVGDLIKKYRQENRLSMQEFADKAGLSKSYINMLEKNYNSSTHKEIEPTVKTIHAVAKAMGMSPSELFTKATNIAIKLTDEDRAKIYGPGPYASPKESKGVRIPVLGRVVAGIPLEAIEDIEDYEEIPRRMASSGEFFALRVKGHSMEPKLSEGDIVIVRKQEDVDSGDTAIVLVNGDEATVKQIKKTEAGIMLIGFNVEVYQPHFYSNDQIENLPVRIIGKVVESRHKW